jgi:hypothetical protein
MLPDDIDWMELKERFIEGEWETLQEMATALDIRYGLVRTWASKGEVTWIEEREFFRAEAWKRGNQRALEQLAGNLQGVFAKSILDRLQDAAKLRDKALKALASADEKMGMSQAIEALRNAAQIEKEIFDAAKVQSPKQLDGGQAGRHDPDAEQTLIDHRAELERRVLRIIDTKPKADGVGGPDPEAS